LHRRAYTARLPYASTVVTEINGARSRRLEQTYNGGATLSFVVGGSSAAAPLIRELQHDVIAWRWDDTTDADVPVFRGLVTQSQDTLSEQANTVTFTCHDYLAMLGRRLLTARYSPPPQYDQDFIVALLVQWARYNQTASGVALTPGSYLPIETLTVDPSGAYRPNPSRVLRDRTYEGQQKIDEAISNLAACDNGFDYDVAPVGGAGGDDVLRIFYPYQGVLRTDLVLEYGSSVRALSRSVNSADYGNYWRVVGATPPTDSTAPPMYAEKWNADANDVTRVPVGLWQSGDNASDVSVQTTLNEHAGADLARSGVLVPSYSLDLRPDWYTWGNPRMGDVVTLRVRAGRLDVDTEVRVVGVAYDIGEDGDETVSLTVGRPDVTFGDLWTRTDRDINALARR
jgi:hypothetical protein